MHPILEVISVPIAFTRPRGGQRELEESAELARELNQQEAERRRQRDARWEELRRWAGLPAAMRRTAMTRTMPRRPVSATLMVASRFVTSYWTRRAEDAR